MALLPRPNQRHTVALGLTLVFGLALACKARQPSGTERVIAAAVKRHLTVGGAGDQNPLPATEENVRRGSRAFSSYCFVCHGLDGQNTGVPFATSMSPPVPLLSSPEVQRYADGQLHAVIRDGIFPSGMPASAGLLSDQEIWSIVVFLRHLPPAGSLGEPPVYGSR